MGKIECPNFGVMTGGVPFCKAQALGLCPPVVFEGRQADSANRLVPGEEDKCFENFVVTVVPSGGGRFRPMVEESTLPKPG